MDTSTPAITWNTKTHLSLEPQALFHYFADFSSTRNWDPSVTDATVLQDGSIGKGSTFELQFKIGLSTRQFHYEIIEYNPPSQLILKSEGQDYIIYDHISIRPDLVNPSHSMLEYKLTLHYKNPNFVSIWLGKRILRYFADKAVRNLKLIPLAHSGRIKNSSTVLHQAILPAAINFTQFGFFRSKKNLQPLPMNCTGLKIVLTGCTSGIGREIAVELSRVGAEIIMINRTEAKADQLAQQLKARFKNTIHSYIADLSQIQETLQVAQSIKKEFPSLDVLINNAGELINTREETSEGFERHFAVLLLAPFTLTQILLPSLEFKRGTESTLPPAKVINICSGGLFTQGIQLDDLNSTEGEFSGAKAYARAKRGLLDITEHTARLYDKHTVVFHAMHPGWVQTPGLEKSLSQFFKVTKPILRTPFQGADTAIWLAISRASDHFSGKFWFDRQIQPTRMLPNTQTHPSNQAELFSRLHLLMNKITKKSVGAVNQSATPADHFTMSKEA